MIMKVAAALVREKFAGFTAELIFLGLHSIILITVHMVTGIIFRGEINQFIYSGWRGIYFGWVFIFFYSFIFYFLFGFGFFSVKLFINK